MRLYSYCFLSLLTTFFTLPAQAQTWLAPDAVFTYHLTGGFAGVSDYFNLQAGADTTIHGRDCRKMTVSGAMYNYPESRFAYAENDRVYAYQALADSFVLLYDFNLQPGQIVSIPRQFGGSFAYRIDSLDTLQAGDFLVRRQLVTYLNPDGTPSDWIFEILEGLGMTGQPTQINNPARCSYFFLDEVFCSSVVDGFDFQFICYRSDSGAYTIPGANCAVVSTPEPGREPRLALSPNPAADRLLLSASGLPGAVLTTQVFGANGACLFTQKGLPAAIDLGAFPQGLYFLALALDNGAILTQRFVKG